MIAFLRKKDKFISLVLKHIDTSAMMDLLLRLISCVEPASLRQEVLNVRTSFFLSSQDWELGGCLFVALRNGVLFVTYYESRTTLLSLESCWRLHVEYFGCFSLFVAYTAEAWVSPWQ